MKANASISVLVARVGLAWASRDPANTIFFTTPATDFSSVLLVGNGRLGGSVYGGADEQVWLNEDSTWTGNYRQRVNPKAKDSWQQARLDLIQERFLDAGNTALADLVPDPDQVRQYQPAGHLAIDTAQDESSFTNYTRTLDTFTGLVNINYVYEGITYSREVFASQPDSALGVRWRASQPSNATVYLERYVNCYSKLATVNGTHLTLSLDGGSDAQPGQLDFRIEARVIPVDGNVSIINGNAFVLTNTRGFDVLLDIQTTYRYPDPSQREAAITRHLYSAASKGYDGVKAAALADYQSLFNRISLDLGSSDSSIGQLTTDQRQIKFRDAPDDDPQLMALMYNYGRYLTISSSRAGVKPLPPNLQGIWNVDYYPAWGSRFTLNINTEMLDWPSGPTGTAWEMVQPLFSLLDLCRDKGRTQASLMYGLPGFVMHHNADLWGDVAPNDNGTEYSIWPMSPAWLGTHLLESYRFSGDKTFLLQKTLPWLSEAAKFYYSYLLDYNGHLVTGPSLSPEAPFYIPQNAQGAGQRTGIDIATSMDRQLLIQFFSDIIEGYTAVGRGNDPNVSKAIAARSKLLPPQIGSYGQILEWRAEYTEIEPGHRHFSPLFGLFPGSAMTPLVNATLANASAILLDHRLANGGGSTGWSRAWASNLYARLYNGAKAWSNAQILVQSSILTNMLNSDSGPGSPFQMDGNAGFVSAIHEMILQSHANVTHLLPAMSPNVAAGSVTGIVGRGGFTADIKWNAGGGLNAATITSQRGNNLSLLLANGSPFLVNGQPYHGDSIQTTVGQQFAITVG